MGCIRRDVGRVFGLIPDNVGMGLVQVRYNVGMGFV